MIIYKLTEDDTYFITEEQVSDLSCVAELLKFQMVECPYTGTIELMEL